MYQTSVRNVAMMYVWYGGCLGTVYTAQVIVKSGYGWTRRIRAQYILVCIYGFRGLVVR
ncbi:hypothetical protein F5Y07DRAFT_141556 [Xylaria sp. FL0933]|nr:hypothetical protein F5Y07DRAFT_141556 [Xylaria sp. FL0933]